MEQLIGIHNVYSTCYKFISVFHFTAELYWIAPELLREVHLPFNGTQKADVFSFAIIMREIIYSTEVGPYHDIQLEPKGNRYFCLTSCTKVQ